MKSNSPRPSPNKTTKKKRQNAADETSRDQETGAVAFLTDHVVQQRHPDLIVNRAQVCVIYHLDERPVFNVTTACHLFYLFFISLRCLVSRWLLAHLLFSKVSPMPETNQNSSSLEWCLCVCGGGGKRGGHDMSGCKLDPRARRSFWWLRRRNRRPL